MGWVDNYLNQPSVKAELGVSPEREFATCNMDVNQAFALSGDWSNSALLLPELVNDGVRLLVYAGNAGQYCFCLFLKKSWDCILHSLGFERVDYELCYSLLPSTIDNNHIKRHGWALFLVLCPVLNMLHAIVLSGGLWLWISFCSLGIASMGVMWKKRSITRDLSFCTVIHNHIDLYLSLFFFNFFF